MRIGFRTIKTGVGVSVSIFIALLFELEYYTSAGILTLLCIQKTRKQSLDAVLERFFACILGLIVSCLVFWALGYHAFLFIPIFLLFIPLTVKLKIQNGIASATVIMTHTFMHGTVNPILIGNELMIIFVGLGTALLVNVYMPGLDKKLLMFQKDINDKLSVILKEYAKYLKEGYGLWDGKELLELSDLLVGARNMAVVEVENNLTRKRNPFFFFVEAKQRQFHILERMLPMVSQLDAKLEQGHRIGQFIDELSEHIHEIGDISEFTEKLRQIREYHKQLPMPQDRAEFENRAMLFGLANELERLIESC